MKVYMTFSKSTKGTHVYKEVEESGLEMISANATIPSLYIRKSAFRGKEIPKTITVTVELK